MPHSTKNLSAQAADRSLGRMLSAAREERGILLEQAARDTRIRAQRLREIENNDLSHFPHPSYARLFLVDYAKYLGIPFAEIRGFLPDSGACGTEGYQYLQDVPGESASVRFVRRVRPRRLMPALAGVAALVVCLLVGFQLYLTMRNINRLGLADVTQADRALLDRSAGTDQPVPAGSSAVPESEEANGTRPGGTGSSVEGSSEQAARGERAAFFVGGTVAPEHHVR